MVFLELGVGRTFDELYPEEMDEIEYALDFRGIDYDWYDGQLCIFDDFDYARVTNIISCLGYDYEVSDYCYDFY